MSFRIVKFPLAGNPERPIVVEVTSKKGGHKLDLDLLATDGDEAWRGKVRQRHLDRLRDSEYSGSQQEWEDILEFALSSTPQANLSDAIREGLDVQCRQSGQHGRSKLIINLQISVEDIKSKRGSLQLDYAKNTDDVSFYDWTTQLINERNVLQNQVRMQQAASSGDKAKIEALQQQMEDLITSKREQETQLLAKFTHLLNEKKLRIRIQQRQIAQQDRPAQSGTSEKSISARKRKNERAEDDSQSDLESEAFENMDVDRDEVEEQAEASDQGRRTDSDTVSEDEESPKGVVVSAQPRTSTKPSHHSLPFSTKAKREPESSPVVGQESTKDTMAASDDTDTASEEDDEL